MHSNSTPGGGGTNRVAAAQQLSCGRAADGAHAPGAFPVITHVE